MNRRLGFGLAAAVVLVAIAWALWPKPPLSAEEQVRRMTVQLVRSAEARDVGAMMESVSNRFRGAGGLDREGIRLREVPLDVGLADAFADHRRRIAYERLLLDLIDGDPTLFVRRDEVEAQWHWIDGVRAAWHEAGVTPMPYSSGSWGPSAAIALTERDGVHWHD